MIVKVKDSSKLNNENLQKLVNDGYLLKTFDKSQDKAKDKNEDKTKDESQDKTKSEVKNQDGCPVGFVNNTAKL